MRTQGVVLGLSSSNSANTVQVSVKCDQLQVKHLTVLIRRTIGAEQHLRG